MRVNIFDQISAIGGTLGLFTGVSLITFVEGGFQLEFLSLSRVINHMTCYNSSALIGWNYKGGFFSESVIRFFKSPKQNIPKTILSLKLKQ